MDRPTSAPRRRKVLCAFLFVWACDGQGEWRILYLCRALGPEKVRTPLTLLGCLRDQITKSPQIDLLATAVTPPCTVRRLRMHTGVGQILALLGISRTSTPEECRAGSGRRLATRPQHQVQQVLLCAARHAPHPGGPAPAGSAAPSKGTYTSECTHTRNAHTHTYNIQWPRHMQDALVSAPSLSTN